MPWCEVSWDSYKTNRFIDWESHSHKYTFLSFKNIQHDVYNYRKIFIKPLSKLYMLRYIASIFSHFNLILSFKNIIHCHTSSAWETFFPDGNLELSLRSHTSNKPGHHNHCQSFSTRYNGQGKPTASSISANVFPLMAVQISNHRMAILRQLADGPDNVPEM